MATLEDEGFLKSAGWTKDQCAETIRRIMKRYRQAYEEHGDIGQKYKRIFI